MVMEVEEAFPSFSTERIRSKVHIREVPVTQRRLDYNAPLLSVRRLADNGGDQSSKIWKLSAELCKEPLRVPGAVPFTWEHSPGRPKQPESSRGEVASVSAPAYKSPPQSPPRTPSSPSPPSTPSPPSGRRASPASPPLPPPPPLRPLFLRSDSYTLFAPPPPPPPPPPPLPCMQTQPIIARRSAPQPKQPLPSSSSTRPPPPPPPPPPPTHNHPFIPGSARKAHERAKPFCLVDPTEDLLRAIRARREKLDREASLAAGPTDEASEVRSEEARVVNATSDADANCDKTINETAEDTDNRSCGVVDAIVQRFLADHPDTSAEEEVCRESQDSKTQQGHGQVILDAANCDALTSTLSVDDEASKQHSKHILTNVSNPCTDDIPLQEHVPALQGGPNESDEGEAGMCRLEIPYDAHVCTSEKGESEPVAATECMRSQQLTEAVEVQTEAGHKQISLIKKQQNKRRINSIAILDSCRVESFGMIKRALVQLCRKAAAASLQTLSRARRKVTPSCRDSSSSVEVVVHHKAGSTLNGTLANGEEKTVVVRELVVIPHQERLSPEKQSEVQIHAISLPPSATGPHEQAMELHEQRCVKVVKKQDRTPISSPKFAWGLQEMYESIETKHIAFSPTPPPPPPPSSPPHPVLSREQSLELPAVMENTSFSEAGHNIPYTEHHASVMQGSPDSQSTMQEETREPRLSHTSSVRHVYAKSLGGDESNEFYDASSRFGSRSSTPSRIHSNRSMSRDWGQADDFLDATSTPFETPRTSVSERRYSFSASSPSIAPRVGSSNRPTSKLSKRVGKALWVDTRDINATGETLCISPVKHFYSGELFIGSCKKPITPNEEEPQCARRKCVSGDQASSSTSQARRHNKRGMSSSTNAKSAAQRLAVTPVFPSKCQKNRSIASASGLPRQISTENMQDVGWPLGISGYPPLKTSAKEKAESRLTKKGLNSAVVPSPPLPPSPAGGSWLRKALSSNTLQQAPSRLAGLQQASAGPACKKPSSPNNPNSPNKWQDIVRGSHSNQPGHLRFSEELHHIAPNSDSNKYYVS